MIMRRTDRTIRNRVAALTASAALVVSSSRVGAQTPDVSGTARIEGRVIDTTDARIDNAIVEVLGVSRVATDDNGIYRIHALASGTYILRVLRLGYTTQIKTVLLHEGEVRRLDIELTPTTPQLDRVTVTADGTGRPAIDDPTGFNGRRKMSVGGVFVTEEDIAHRAPVETQDIFRTVRGVCVADGGLLHNDSSGKPCGSTGSPIPAQPAASRVRISANGTSTPPSGQCASMQVFVNGAHVDDQFDINSVPPASIAGIEVYKGAADTPPMFRSYGTICGTVVVWTK
jgi:hypothetical protein